MLPEPLPAHPRLLATTQDWDRIRQQIKDDHTSAVLFDAVQTRADSMLDAPPVIYEKEGRRLLDVSRRLLTRVCVLAMTAKVTNDDRYAKRAIDEMLAAVNFSDWNPVHYLDTAEMAFGVAIGYDWLYDTLTPEQADLIAAALIEKGIAPSYDESSKQWWITGNNNWNQVCHSGLSAAAIAIADRDPELAERVLQRAVECLPHVGEGYKPDGVYPEGSMYWNYGTVYHVLLAAALERLTGDTHGVDGFPGFSETGTFINQMTMPSGNYYNYSDNRLNRGLLEPLFWLSRRFQRPEWLAHEVDQIDHFVTRVKKLDAANFSMRFLPFALLWYDPALQAKAPDAKLPRHWHGRGPVPVVVHRSADDSLVVAVKGGSPSASHAHMDIGSFILEADGVRWFVDTGMQEYHSLESIGVQMWNSAQDGQRWEVFRLGPESHSIPRFNGSLQRVDGKAAFVRFQSEGATPHSVLDLSTLYADQVTRAWRGLMVLGDEAVLMQDEWTAGDAPADAIIQLLTEADVDVHADGFDLRQDGKTLRIRVLDGADVELTVQDAAELLKPYDTPNPGLKRLTLSRRTAAGETDRLRVLFLRGGDVTAPGPQALADWSAPLP